MKKCSKNAAQTVPKRLIGGPPGQEPIAFFKSGNRFFGRSVSARARPDAPDNLFRTVVFAFSDGFARLGPDRRIPPDGTELKKGSNEKKLRNCF